MSTVVTMQLQESQLARLRKLAHRLGHSPSEMGALLIEEALRMADFNLVNFRDSPVGRQAYIVGSSLAVWEVIWLLRHHDDDIDRTAEYLDWPPFRIQAAVDYASAFPAEIDAAIEDNESYDLEALKRELPQLKVFTATDVAENAAPIVGQ